MTNKQYNNRPEPQPSGTFLRIMRAIFLRQPWIAPLTLAAITLLLWGAAEARPLAQVVRATPSAAATPKPTRVPAELNQVARFWFEGLGETANAELRVSDVQLLPRSDYWDRADDLNLARDAVGRDTVTVGVISLYVTNTGDKRSPFARAVAPSSSTTNRSPSLTAAQRAFGMSLPGKRRRVWPTLSWPTPMPERSARCACASPRPARAILSRAPTISSSTASARRRRQLPR